MSFSNEAFIAFVTCEWSCSSVGSEMSSQVTTLGEEFAALEEGAFKGAFTAFLAFKFYHFNYALLTSIKDIPGSASRGRCGLT